jgi:hypothetical protein
MITKAEKYQNIRRYLLQGLMNINAVMVWIFEVICTIALVWSAVLILVARDPMVTAYNGAKILVLLVAVIISSYYTSGTVVKEKSDGKNKKGGHP